MTTFTVDDMSCAHCTASIEKAIRAVDPGARIECDLESKEVVIESALHSEAFAAAIRDAGYAPHTA